MSKDKNKKIINRYGYFYLEGDSSLPWVPFGFFGGQYLGQGGFEKLDLLLAIDPPYNINRIGYYRPYDGYSNNNTLFYRGFGGQYDFYKLKDSIKNKQYPHIESPYLYQPINKDGIFTYYDHQWMRTIFDLTTPSIFRTFGDKYYKLGNVDSIRQHIVELNNNTNKTQRQPILITKNNPGLFTYLGDDWLIHRPLVEFQEKSFMRYFGGFGGFLGYNTQQELADNIREIGHGGIYYPINKEGYFSYQIGDFQQSTHWNSGKGRHFFYFGKNKSIDSKIDQFRDWIEKSYIQKSDDSPPPYQKILITDKVGGYYKHLMDDWSLEWNYGKNNPFFYFGDKDDTGKKLNFNDIVGDNTQTGLVNYLESIGHQTDQKNASIPYQKINKKGYFGYSYGGDFSEPTTMSFDKNLYYYFGLDYPKSSDDVENLRNHIKKSYPPRSPSQGIPSYQKILITDKDGGYYKYLGDDWNSSHYWESSENRNKSYFYFGGDRNKYFLGNTDIDKLRGEIKTSYPFNENPNYPPNYQKIVVSPQQGKYFTYYEDDWHTLWPNKSKPFFYFGEGSNYLGKPDRSSLDDSLSLDYTKQYNPLFDRYQYQDYDRNRKSFPIYFYTKHTRSYIKGMNIIPNINLIYGLGQMPGVGGVFRSIYNLYMIYLMSVKIVDGVGSAWSNKSVAGGILKTFDTARTTFDVINRTVQFHKYKSVKQKDNKFPLQTFISLYPQKKYKNEIDKKNLHYYSMQNFFGGQTNSEWFNYLNPIGSLWKQNKKTQKKIKDRISNKISNYKKDIKVDEEKTPDTHNLLQAHLQKQVNMRRSKTWFSEGGLMEGKNPTMTENWWNPQGFYRWEKTTYDQDGFKAWDKQNQLKEEGEGLSENIKNIKQEIIKEQRVNILPYMNSPVSRFNPSIYRQKENLIRILQNGLMMSDNFKGQLDRNEKLWASDTSYGNPIKFEIENKTMNKGLIVPIFLNGQISDKMQPQWEEITYPGQLYPRAHYKGTGFRTIDFSFKLICFSMLVLNEYVNNINFIKNLALPKLINKGGIDLPQAPICTLTLGDIIYKQLGFFDQVEVEYQQDSMIWNLMNSPYYDEIYNIQIPIICNINLKFNALYSKIPSFDKEPYKIYEKRGNHNFEYYESYGLETKTTMQSKNQSANKNLPPPRPLNFNPLDEVEDSPINSRRDFLNEMYDLKSFIYRYK